MLFNSYIFVFVFLPITLIGYFVLNQKKQYTVALLFLFAMSMWFYGYFNYVYLLIMVASIGINYILTKWMGRVNSGRRKILLIVALTFNIGLIFYFKYYDFFIENVNMVFGTNFVLRNILMPLGISFFTIQQISYVVDVFEGKTEAASLLYYAVYVSFFPQLIAGPIVRYDEMIPQIKDMNKKKFCWENFSRGVYRFVLGMSKKVLIADMFGVVADYGFANYASLNAISTFFAMFSYTIQIYFDFSGYSDMAIGLGNMFNFRLPENFVSPYKASSIVEFWSRWHLTLTRFLREYIYFPLGGSKKGKLRTYVNIMIVFLVSGIWHGANWTFILWGIIHGAVQCIERVGKRQIEKIPKVIRWGGTFVFLIFTWALFRAESWMDFVEMLKRLNCWSDLRLNDVMQNMVPLEIRMIIQSISYFWSRIHCLTPVMPIFSCVACILIVVKAKNTAELEASFQSNGRSYISLAILAYLCVISFSSVSSFIYFNF